MDTSKSDFSEDSRLDKPVGGVAQKDAASKVWVRDVKMRLSNFLGYSYTDYRGRSIQFPSRRKPYTPSTVPVVRDPKTGLILTPKAVAEIIEQPVEKVRMVPQSVGLQEFENWITRFARNELRHKCDMRQQELNRKMVQQEVLTCQSMLVSHLLSSEVIGYDDIINSTVKRSDGDLRYDYPDETALWDQLNKGILPDRAEEIEALRAMTLHDYLGHDHFLDVEDEDGEELSEKSLRDLYPDECRQWDDIQAGGMGYGPDHLLELEAFYDEHLELSEYLEYYHAVEVWEDQEAYEWWVVSDFLQRHLMDRDEIFIESEYESWWGRGGTGQAIYLDSVMTDIQRSVEYGGHNEYLFDFLSTDEWLQRKY